MKLELENPIFIEASRSQNLKQNSSSNRTTSSSSDEQSSSRSNSNDLCGRTSSFRGLEMELPTCKSEEKKLDWLRSQVIGGYDTEFDSPFGKRILSYADHTASARSLHYIENFISSNVLPFYGNTHTCDSYVGQRTTKMVKEATKYIKKCLGGSNNGQEDSLIFCGSGTTSAIKRLQEVMGIAVPSILRERMIKTLRKEERWVVFVGPYEHHSNILSWRQSLAEVIEIGLDREGLIDMEELRNGIDKFKFQNRPILGCFSGCSNVSGIYSNTRAIAMLLHSYGGFACFDFAASAPYVKIDMRSGEMDGYDAIFLSTHKFLGGPGSPGILLMNKALYQLKSSPPSTCGGGTVSYVNGFSEEDTLYLENIEERENGGTPQIIQIIRAALAFWVKEYITHQLIEKQEQSYIKKAIQRLIHNKNIHILGNTNVKRQAIMSFIIYSTTNCSSTEGREEGEVYNMWGEIGKKRDKPLHGPFVAALLSDLFGIQARGGCSCAGPYGHSLLNIDQSQSLAYRSAIQKGYNGVKPGWTRVSFPYYMSDEEFDFILDALEFIASFGQRFLPLYNFNLRNGSWKLKKKTLKELVRQDYDNVEAKADVTKAKYGSYLETAMKIANLLPKFPSQRKLPEEIDHNLIYFRL